MDLQKMSAEAANISRREVEIFFEGGQQGYEYSSSKEYCSGRCEWNRRGIGGAVHRRCEAWLHGCGEVRKGSHHPRDLHERVG